MNKRMTVSEGLKVLENCREKWIARLNCCIASYAQYGMTLPQIEAAIANEQWQIAKTQISACLNEADGCDLKIVNPSGDTGRILMAMHGLCDSLLKNQDLTRRVRAWENI